MFSVSAKEQKYSNLNFIYANSSDNDLTSDLYKKMDCKYKTYYNTLSEELKDKALSDRLVKKGYLKGVPSKGEQAVKFVFALSGGIASCFGIAGIVSHDIVMHLLQAGYHLVKDSYEIVDSGHNILSSHTYTQIHPNEYPFDTTMNLISQIFTWHFRHELLNLSDLKCKAFALKHCEQISLTLEESYKEGISCEEFFENVISMTHPLPKDEILLLMAENVIDRKRTSLLNKLFQPQVYFDYIDVYFSNLLVKINQGYCPHHFIEQISKRALFTGLWDIRNYIEEYESLFDIKLKDVYEFFDIHEYKSISKTNFNLDLNNPNINNLNIYESAIKIKELPLEKFFKYDVYFIDRESTISVFKNILLLFMRWTVLNETNASMDCTANKTARKIIQMLPFTHTEKKLSKRVEILEDKVKRLESIVGQLININNIESANFQDNDDSIEVKVDIAEEKLANEIDLCIKDCQDEKAKILKINEIFSFKKPFLELSNIYTEFLKNNDLDSAFRYWIAMLAYVAFHRDLAEIDDESTKASTEKIWMKLPILQPYVASTKFYGC